jgi:hypothetical protein
VAHFIGIVRGALMTPFNMLWAPHQAAVYLLGSNETEVRSAGYLWCYLRDQILEAAMGGRIHFIMAEDPPIGDYPHDIELPGKRLELIEQERLRFKPVDVIEWALHDGDIPVSPECRSWFAKQTGMIAPNQARQSASNRQAAHGKKGATAKKSIHDERNQKIRSRHRMLLAESSPEPISALCAAFSLSRSQIHRIIKKT